MEGVLYYRQYERTLFLKVALFGEYLIKIDIVECICAILKDNGIFLEDT